ncbi:unnamed protein product [Lymnaea stagnalis]|uniref:Protein FAM161A n=1 Tax=Lymnaea stagnalis TaxID=6523 RepID=A0AAV2HBB2_LYMST
MATMTSTSHGLSVLANSCVKNPINPKTGLKANLHDKNAVRIRFDDALNEVHSSILPESSTNTYGITALSGGYHKRPDNKESEEPRISKEEEFYEKLQQLKEENRQTLEAYKRLYQEKVIIEGIRNSQTFDFQRDKSGLDRNVEETTLSINGISGNNIKERSIAFDKKPPLSKPKSSVYQGPLRSKTLPIKSQHVFKKERPRSAPIEGKSYSLDDKEWSKFFDAQSSNGSLHDNNFVISSESEHSLNKVKQLWDDFKISEYTQRRHSFSSAQSDADGSQRGKKEWRHRITIPKPFNMSIREALKEKKKTKAQLELEQRQLEKQKQEEAECEKKFKAQPVPSHVYLPKYEEIMERNESRRQYVKQYCQELLKSQVKPFKFEIREKEKKLQSAQSAPLRKPEKPKPNFKANPVPKHIFSSEIDEKFLEEEELRKIRVKMRSKELLYEASLPPSMAAREKLKEQERKEKAHQAKLSAKKKHRSKNMHIVPDYDALYSEFQKGLARRKSMKEGTITEPFDLETERIRSSHDKIRRDIEEDERQLKENRWPFQSSRLTPRSSLKYLGALSNSLDAIPTQSSKAADLRTIKAKKEQERLNNRLREEDEAERRRKAREAQLRRYLSEKTNADDIPRPRDSIAERLKQKKQEDRMRQEAYQREIEEMKKRVEDSPLLVEKVMKDIARKEAEKKFSSTVNHAGLDEKEFLNSTHSRSPGRDSSYSYENTDKGTTHYESDLTYTKETEVYEN